MSPKRKSSESPSNHDSNDGSSFTQSPPPTKKRALKATPSTPSPSKLKKTASPIGTSSPVDWKATEGWTKEKKKDIMECVIAAGAAQLDKAALAEKYGVSKVTIINALTAGRKGNLRDKAIQPAGE